MINIFFSIRKTECTLIMNDPAIVRSGNNFSSLVLRWLDIVFQGQYLPSLSVNCVAINKDLEKLTPQLH